MSLTNNTYETWDGSDKKIWMKLWMTLTNNTAGWDLDDSDVR